MFTTSANTLYPQPPAAAGRKIRVLVVDDSAVIRKLLTQALERDPSIEVIGTAPNGILALQRIQQSPPDIVTLDIEMPELDGIETLRRIRSHHPLVRVIMVSTLTERGASVTIDALTLGASDYVTKTSHASGAESPIEALQRELVPKIKQFYHPPQISAPKPPVPVVRPPVAAAAAPLPQGKAVQPEVLTIGVSTGGPTALHETLCEIPSHFPLPVLIVQHMPPLFTKLLADRLASKCKLPVDEARDGQPIEAGKIYIAPGDFHMRAAGVPGRARITLDQGPQENSCRPAVDVLFRSVGDVWGASAIGVVLTGMGSDGLTGCERLREKGAYLIAQDEASSVVWGMPGFVAKAGLADKILPLHSIIPDIISRCQAGMRNMLRHDGKSFAIKQQGVIR